MTSCVLIRKRARDFKFEFWHENLLFVFFLEKAGFVNFWLGFGTKNYFDSLSARKLIIKMIFSRKILEILTLEKKSSCFWFEKLFLSAFDAKIFRLIFDKKWFFGRPLVNIYCMLDTEKTHLTILVTILIYNSRNNYQSPLQWVPISFWLDQGQNAKFGHWVGKSEISRYLFLEPISISR